MGTAGAVVGHAPVAEAPGNDLVRPGREVRVVDEKDRELAVQVHIAEVIPLAFGSGDAEADEDDRHLVDRHALERTEHAPVIVDAEALPVKPLVLDPGLVDAARRLGAWADLIVIRSNTASEGLRVVTASPDARAEREPTAERSVDSAPDRH